MIFVVVVVVVIDVVVELSVCLGAQFLRARYSLSVSVSAASFEPNFLRRAPIAVVAKDM